MKSVLLASLLIISSVSWADENLRARAEKESSIDARKSQALASDAQVPSGMLQLKDPRPEVITRQWKYFAGLTLQNFQPRGTISTASTGNFDLGKNDASVMPGLTLGVMSADIQTRAVIWQFGVRGDGSFSSQDTSVTFPSGFHVDDARLNTTLLSVGPAMSLQWERLHWLAFTFTPQYGTVNYTQTSSNDFAHFSKQSGYLALNYGLDFQIGPKWSVFTEYSNRSLRDSNQEIALQQDNFELGTKVAW